MWLLVILFAMIVGAVISGPPGAVVGAAVGILFVLSSIAAANKDRT